MDRPTPPTLTADTPSPMPVPHAPQQSAALQHPSSTRASSRNSHDLPSSLPVARPPDSHKHTAPHTSRHMQTTTASSPLPGDTHRLAYVGSNGWIAFAAGGKRNGKSAQPIADGAGMRILESRVQTGYIHAHAQRLNRPRRRRKN